MGLGAEGGDRREPPRKAPGRPRATSSTLSARRTPISMRPGLCSLAAQRFRATRYQQEALRIGAGIMGAETVDAGGSRILVAGPWATAFPYSVNPSYFSPRTFALLADASGQSGWQALTTSSYAVVRSLTSGGPALPPDWTVLDAAGTAHPSAAAGDWPQRRGRFSGLPA